MATEERRLRFKFYWLVLQKVFIFGDMTAIRALMAAGSCGWTVGLWLPLTTFDRPAYAIMKYLANEWVWGAAFLLHALGVVWRFTDRKARNNWAMCVHGWGLFIWLISTGSITLAVGEYTPSTALEWTLIAAAAVAFVRTGRNEELISP